jgi:hypothetical protein
MIWKILPLLLLLLRRLLLLRWPTTPCFVK